ncbi:MAG TPA: sugar phosphate isomerase/epimerase family protein [Armatimonadota bacterium]|jgi:fatty-acyl-CoA synthase
MQLAFSTLGCPEWTLARILEVARREGFAGIEFHGLLGSLDLAQAPEFTSAHIAETRAQLRAAGVQAACLACDMPLMSAVGDEVDRRQALSTVEAYLDMAKAVDAPFVRIPCGALPVTLLPAEVTERAINVLRLLGDFAQARGVTLLLDTRDAFTDSRVLEELLRLTRHRAIRALWDLESTYRQAGESPAQTIAHLGTEIRYVLLKDSVLNADGEQVTLVPVGTGELPIDAALHALRAQGYASFLTLEWEKRTHPELSELDVVLPHFRDQVQGWLAKAA